MTVDRSYVTETFPEPKQKEIFTLDYKRIIFRVLQRWYLVVLCIIVALVIAYVKNRYSARIYPVTASIIIKETEDTGGGELLYKNALVDPYRNYLNELYIIRSYPVIQSVVDDLNFGSTFYREGNILTSELYDFPVSVKVLNQKEVKSARLKLTVLSDRQFTLAQNTDAPISSGQTFNFSDTISYSNISMVVRVRDDKALPAQIGQTVTYSFTAPELLAGTYVGKLGVEWAEEGAGVIYLSAMGTNPQKDIDFLYGVIKRYQVYDLEKKNRTASRTIEFITEQLASISDSLKRVENILERFKESNVTNISAETSRLYEKLEAADAQKTDLLVRENYYKYLRDYITNGQSLGLVILPSSIEMNDGLLGTFISSMIEMENQMQILVDKEKMNNPVARDQKAKLEKVKENILEALVNQEATDKIRKGYIEKQIKTLEGQLAGLPSAERKYVAIQRNYSLLENLYIFLLQKRAEASISKASNTSDIVIVNPPMAGGAISPTPRQNYLVAGLIGAAIPLLAFVILELLNTKVQSREDVERLTKIPFIGGIGRKKSGDNLVVANSPKSSVTESFRALRSNLTYFLGDRKKGVVLITSSISGEGKSFTTINLASVVASSGAKTLILGADLRKPKLYGDFGLSNTIGLSSFLAGNTGFEATIQHTVIPNLDVVVSGPVPPNPSELILTSRMDAFMVEAQQRYDFVIIDSPPLAIVADAFVLAKYADHTIFLIRQDYTPKHLLGTIDESYANGRLKNMSILLNDIYKSGPGYGYGYGYTYGYGYGYGYGQDGKNGYGYYSES